MVNPINSDWSKSTATTNEAGTLVVNLRLLNELSVPLSIFCLKNLQSLYISSTPFPNNIVPDDLKNLKQLAELQIYNSPVKNMTEQLGSLTNLNRLYLQSCSLTRLPDLSGLYRLQGVYLDNNRLHEVTGLNSVTDLGLSDNLFIQIPILANPGDLRSLTLDRNPLKNMLAITSHTNIYYLNLQNSNLTSVPATIDKLQNLEQLYLSYNKLFYIPTNILKLTKLQYLYIQNNLFSTSDLQTIKNQFNKTLPSVKLYS
ncbi:hypothetical protein I4U23_019805 [Adineta vaga]|nr:hypothetical protein I4U23_019805 [Adineta vaga]